MLIWIFGGVKRNIVHLLEQDKAAGFLELEKARIRWYLSLDYNDIPDEIKKQNIRTFRSIIMNNEKFEFSDGFTDLHTRSYEAILNNKGFGLKEAKPSIETVFNIRNAKPVGLKGEYHELCKKQ